MKKFNPATSLENVHELGAYNGVNQSINDSATFAFEDGNAMEGTEAAWVTPLVREFFRVITTK